MSATLPREEGVTALVDEFDRLDTLFQSGVASDKDLSLCFVCLRWTTGDEGCRRGYRCEIEQLLLDPPAPRIAVATR